MYKLGTIFVFVKHQGPGCKIDHGFGFPRQLSLNFQHGTLATSDVLRSWQIFKILTLSFCLIIKNIYLHTCDGFYCIAILSFALTLVEMPPNKPYLEGYLLLVINLFPFGCFSNVARNQIFVVSSFYFLLFFFTLHCWASQNSTKWYYFFINRTMDLN